MLKFATVALFLLTALTALAQEDFRSSDAAKSFCDERTQSTSGIQELVSEPKNQLAFTNRGGIFGGGVCWWHSRFTRSTAYLAVFDASLPRPTDEEAKKIISRLRDRKGMTLIPGFRNLQEFSSVYPDEIQNKLNLWQRADGIFKATWVKGISGNNVVAAEELSAKMDELFEQIQKGEVVYQMLQLPGIVAHAWLVTGMEKTNDGYRLRVVDSNLGTDSYVYRQGMTSFNYYSYGDFVPYTGQQSEEQKLLKKLTDFCGKMKGDERI